MKYIISFLICFSIIQKNQASFREITALPTIIGNEILELCARDGGQHFFYNYYSFLAGNSLLQTTGTTIIAISLGTIATIYATKSIIDSVRTLYDSSLKTKIILGTSVIGFYLLRKKHQITSLMRQ